MVPIEEAEEELSLGEVSGSSLTLSSSSLRSSKIDGGSGGNLASCDLAKDLERSLMLHGRVREAGMSNEDRNEEHRILRG